MKDVFGNEIPFFTQYPEFASNEFHRGNWDAASSSTGLQIGKGFYPVQVRFNSRGKNNVVYAADMRQKSVVFRTMVSDKQAKMLLFLDGQFIRNSPRPRAGWVELDDHDMVRYLRGIGNEIESEIVGNVVKRGNVKLRVCLRPVEFGIHLDGWAWVCIVEQLLSEFPVTINGISISVGDIVGYGKDGKEALLCWTKMRKEHESETQRSSGSVSV